MYNDFHAFNNLSDEELIQLVQNRNEAAFAELISRYTPRIRGVIAANSRELRDGEEIHIDIWISVWQNISELRNVDSFGAWLHRIAYNACKRYYTLARKSRSEIPHQHSVIVENIDQYAAARYREAQLIADVRETIHHLPQKVRSVAELFYLESWSIKEISDEFNLAIGTVKTKLREVRTLLREEFDTESIRGTVMSSINVEPHKPIHIEKNKEEPSLIPAQLNVAANDPTGGTWALPEGAIVRFGKSCTAGVKLSPDGTHFAIATSIGLWWYDVSSVSPISLWDSRKGHISSIDFSTDGKHIIIYTKYRTIKTIKVMDIQTGECVKQLDDHDADGDLVCSSNGKWVATAGGDGVVKVLDFQTGECIAQMDRGEHKWQSNDIDKLQFSPDGKLLAAAVGNPYLYSNNELLNPDVEAPQIYVWCPETGEVILKFAGAEFTFSLDSRLLAGACPDETLNDDRSDDLLVSVWDVTSRELLTQFTGHDDEIDAVAFSPCGQFVASSDGILRVWNIATGSEEKFFSDFPDYNNYFYSEDGELFAIIIPSSPNLSFEVWNVERREKIFEISDIDGLAYSFARIYIQQLVKTASYKQTDAKIPKFSTVREPQFPPWIVLQINWLDDKTLVSNDSNGIVLWDVDKKCCRETVSIDGWMDAFTVLTSGKILVSYFLEDSKVCVTSIPDKLIAEFTLPDELLELNRYRAFAPTGEYFATGSREGTIYVWNFKQPEHPIRLKGHTDFVYRTAFSLDGKRLVSGAADETTRVWDVELGEEIARLPMDESDRGWGFVFSPCGNFIAGSLDNEIRFWCANQFIKVRSIPQPEKNSQTHPLAFSPCGQYLAAATCWQEGSENMAIRIWDVNTVEQVHAFHGHNSLVQSLVFSPNGSMLSGGCDNGTILVWNLKPYL
ncbi:MAG: sigma-70 family RNA polymerase sigma factor [Candidatus Poribacteria bacterium]|nr:sigma-70 family RNA polymerase sigma factor [Candidatus Poribacteria bacterium]